MKIFNSVDKAENICRYTLFLPPVLVIKSLQALLLVLVVVSTGCQENKTAAPVVEPVAESSENPIVSLDLVQLMKEGKMPAPESVEIEFDRVFKTTKRYRAYPLRELLRPYLREMGIDSTADASVTFYCTDGYQPTQKVSVLFGGEGYLAFRDESLPDPGPDWPDSVRAKVQPFYVVWKNVPHKNKEFTWAYGLYQMDIHRVDDVYDPITPVNDEIALAGFQHFQQYCIKCHSVNRIGGNLGPEFNDPRNITDYWEVENMWAYAKNPRSFRYNARMKAITPMTRPEFDEIIAYLKYMRGQEPQTALIGEH